LPGPVTADYEAFHLVGFEFLLGSHGGRGFEGGRGLGEERVRGDWRYESIVGSHDDFPCCMKRELQWNDCEVVEERGK
jgi:hypothetical protein